MVKCASYALNFTSVSSNSSGVQLSPGWLGQHDCGYPLSTGAEGEIQPSATSIIQPSFDSSITFPRLSVGTPGLCSLRQAAHWLARLPGSLPLLLLKRP